MRAFVCLTVFIFLGARGSTPADELPILLAADIPQGKILSTTYYTGEGLFGYIDGGAELYLEYGFSKLGRQEIQLLHEKFVLEIYRMQGVNEAYGVFSIHRSKCAPLDSSARKTCRSRYQLQACIADCYIRIVNESGSETAQRASVDLYRILCSKYSDRQPELPALFSDERLKAGSTGVVLIRGILGLQNRVPEWELLFQDIRQFSLTLLPLENGKETCTLAHISFHSSEDLQAFQQCAGFDRQLDDNVQERKVGDVLRYARRVKGNVVLFIESSPAFPEVNSYVQMIAGAQ